MRLLALILLCGIAGTLCAAANGSAAPSAATAPLTMGETFTLESTILAETRVINVYLPPGFSNEGEERLPVLYMPDGGMAEDFLHVAGLVQVSVGNGTMRPFLLVGIENTERCRDLTGPTENAEDRTIAPRVGGSAAFRRFIRQELMPEIRARYRTEPETAIVGESLAGLFVVETFLLEPDLFDTYIAFDPSLWWNDGQLVRDAGDLLRAHDALPKTLYLAASDQAEIAVATGNLARTLETSAVPGLAWHFEPMPGEHHHTIYHPAALKAFRTALDPEGASVSGMGPERETGFLNRTLTFAGTEYRYQVYVPRQYRASAKWPMVLFLHGSGERGDDGLKQTHVGLGAALRYHPERWPALVVFPQAPDGGSWSGGAGRVAMAALEATVSEFSVDDTRIYLTGLSLGGRGVWQLAYKYPERFAALVPVCGFVEGNPRYPDFLPEAEPGPYALLARQVAALPIWIFHGDADTVLPVEGARRMVAALTEVGARVRFSELPGVGHNAWDPAYSSDELATWLFDQRRE